MRDGVALGCTGEQPVRSSVKLARARIVQFPNLREDLLALERIDVDHRADAVAAVTILPDLGGLRFQYFGLGLVTVAAQKRRIVGKQGSVSRVVGAQALFPDFEGAAEELASLRATAGEGCNCCEIVEGSRQQWMVRPHQLFHGG